jgi:hypothetical protein
MQEFKEKLTGLDLTEGQAEDVVKCLTDSTKLAVDVAITETLHTQPTIREDGSDG